MTEKKQDANLKRRGFLLAGSVGAAGAVAVAVAPSLKQVAPVKVAAVPVSGDAGYRETHHVRTYYDLARV
jgi:hypothetical protein